MMRTFILDMFTHVSTFRTLISQDHLMQRDKAEILVTACGHDPPKCFPGGLKGIILMS